LVTRIRRVASAVAPQKASEPPARAAAAAVRIAKVSASSRRADVARAAAEHPAAEAVDVLRAVGAARDPAAARLVLQADRVADHGRHVPSARRALLSLRLPRRRMRRCRT
jgi:hypothetical protein